VPVERQESGRWRVRAGAGGAPDFGLEELQFLSTFLKQNNTMRRRVETRSKGRGMFDRLCAFAHCRTIGQPTSEDRK
jgi:hypothetical protein